MADNTSDNATNKTIILNTVSEINSPYSLDYDQADYEQVDYDQADYNQENNLDSIYLNKVNASMPATEASQNPNSSSSSGNNPKDIAAIKTKGLSARFYLKLFGSPRLYHLNNQVKLGTRKSMALLSYLALRRSPVQRHELDALLWPEKDEKRARRSLRDEISRINKTIGQEIVISFEQELSLSPDIVIDVWQFKDGLKTLDSFHDINISYFEKVIACYEGHLLAGFHIQNAQPYEDWLELERENCQHKYLEAILNLSHGAKNYGNYATAVNYMQKAIEVSPYTEEYYIYAIEYALLNGDRVKAQKLHQDIEVLLLKEFSEGTSENFKTKVASLGLNTSTDFKTSEQMRARKTKTSATNSLAEFEEDELTVTNHNLFEDALPFIGREEELRRLDNLIWEDDCKLITLVGLGGIGKTRLAKRAASLSQAHFPDGIWFVPIEKLDDPHELFSVIAECLSLSLQSMSAYTACMNHLKAKRMLLIFDNLDVDNITIKKHIKTILRLNPGKILVTSTQHLGLKEEWIFDVRGMSLASNVIPNLDKTIFDNSSSKEAEALFSKLTRLDAVQLFIESAKQTQPSFNFSMDNVLDVITICEATDGIPLGLQLATRRLRTLSCEELAEEIRQGSDVLKTTFWDVPNNQRSLKTVFQSAYDSLRPSEKALYKQLASFEGSFDRYEAKELTGASAVDLAHFVERSLLIKDATGCYQMLNFVRRYIDDLT